MSSGPVFANSYNITNRLYPFTVLVDSTTYVVPLPGSELSFYQSQGKSYDSNDEDYYSATQHSFLADLTKDLKLTLDATGHANLVVYIHGLGNTYSDAIAAAADLGTSLQQTGYRGLVIGFSWPSYSEDVAALASYYATSRPPQQTSGTIRDNINGSVHSFLAMLNLLQSLQVNGSPIKMSIICHSEGNFMLMWGIQQYPLKSPKLNNAIMLAADISAAMLQVGQWGQGIAQTFDSVSVYFSGADSDLAYSDYEFFDFHDQTYPTRLGLIGPFAYPTASSVADNVTGIDCSQVAVDLGDPLNVHSSYLSLPSVLTDITSVLAGSAPTGRTLYPGTENPWYYLSLNQEIPPGIRSNLWSGKIKIRPRPKKYFFAKTLINR
jgi:esterase/lipase superfamily enzyme